MAGGEVLDVDVVALAGAVGRGVVVAEDAQPVATTHGDLGDERHEVVGDPLRVLADRAGRVGADGVEVAQDRDAPRGVDVRDVAQHQSRSSPWSARRGWWTGAARSPRDRAAEPGRRRPSRTRRTPASSSRAGAWLAAARTSTGGCSRSSPVASARSHRRPSARRSGPRRRSARVAKRCSVLSRSVRSKACTGMWVPVSASSRRHDGWFGVAEIVDDENLVPGGGKMDDGVRTDVPGPTTDQYSHAHTVCRGSSRTSGTLDP